MALELFFLGFFPFLRWRFCSQRGMIRYDGYGWMNGKECVERYLFVELFIFLRARAYHGWKDGT